MTASSPDDPLVQMNARVPQSIKDRAEERARRLGISRDEWVRRVTRYALDNPTHATTPTVTTTTGRSVRPGRTTRR